jgi:DNA-nicking Smr family endonuclease
MVNKSKKKSKSIDSAQEANDFEMFESSLSSTDWQKVIREKEEGSSSRKMKKKKMAKDNVFDLHGMHLEEAKDFLRTEVQSLSRNKGSIVKVKIVTGRGTHSGPSGGVLCRDIHVFMRQNFFDNIVKIDESPDAVKLNGVPIRGYFFVLFKF